MRAYAVKLEQAAQAEVDKETQAEAKEAKARIEEVMDMAKRIHSESVAHSQAAASAIRHEETKAAIIRRQLQTKLSSQEAISHGMIQQARYETEHYKAIAERQHRDLLNEEAAFQRFENEQMKAVAREQTRNATEAEWIIHQHRAMQTENQKMAQQVQ